MALNADILESSFALVAPRADELVADFYGRLFAAHPVLKPMFADVDLKEQSKKLLAALKMAVNSVRKPDVLLPALREMGARHASYGVRPDHYPMVGAALLETLEAFAGDAWTEEVEEAWVTAYNVIWKTMLEGAEELAA